mmetsp:Transcript_87826/g.284305  ORF Transcript_87826/g.284305 Transcript_87826/m.284305 type:complete len:80 (+) Transcript_87826:407-646(+)
MYGLKANEPESHFSLMAKTNVNGAAMHPVYAFLKKHSGSADIAWNFYTKFLVRCNAETCDVSRYDGKLSSEVLRANDEL